MQTIKQVAEQFNVTYDTLRYYEKIGLLPPIKRGAQGRREYGAAEIEALNKIVHLRQLGASIAECQQIMKLSENSRDVATFDEGIAILQRLDQELNERIARINQQKGFLKQKIGRFEQARQELENGSKKAAAHS
ncbi:MerR family transcriptional regulator [Secundilactobacillus silagei]|uniref:MerR family transcriptional regulator n=1 Tax=Secundilactobacillus silagei JCM 19001 TaxID=1302250 RepID=A0A1Z5II52_9LACO|nr:MerR family transcriptional regulator [Secundilactobacillus silagei]TDG67375.1 hypothetical protein C5L25_000971 [Secundilactobacillus silagei JCM 19001]GAX01318.1 MerR family transcriptional regulator [Secundilactobacillus silagei JCM 19001]